MLNDLKIIILDFVDTYNKIHIFLDSEYKYNNEAGFFKYLSYHYWEEFEI